LGRIFGENHMMRISKVFFWRNFEIKRLLWLLAGKFFYLWYWKIYK